MDKPKKKPYTVRLRDETVQALRARVIKAANELRDGERIPSETSMLEAVIAKALRGGR